MKMNDYQEKARGTAMYPNLGSNPFYPTLGLCGESGEVAEKMKKVMRDDGGIISKEKKQEIAKELGDVCWYISNLASELGFSLEEIAQMNLDKLYSRKERGKLQGSGDNR